MVNSFVNRPNISKIILEMDTGYPTNRVPTNQYESWVMKHLRGTWYDPLSRKSSCQAAEDGSLRAVFHDDLSIFEDTLVNQVVNPE